MNLGKLFDHLPQYHPGLNLLYHCLMIDPKERYTVKDALNHAYLAHCRPNDKDQISPFPIASFSEAEQKLFAAYDQSEKDLETLKEENQTHSKEFIMKMLSDAIKIFRKKPVNTAEVHPASVGYSLFKANKSRRKYIVKANCIHPASRRTSLQP
jgi:serine/threonine protein kinase